MSHRGVFQFGLLVGAVFSAACACAQVQVTGKVVDETGVAVAGARIDLQLSDFPPVTAISDKAGSFSLELPRPGDYSVRAERPGFFLLKNVRAELQTGNNHLLLTLNHLQEFAESVDVTYSPPAIDLQEPAERKELNNVEILSVPYPASQDLRNALPLMNGVVQDVNGRLHFNGGAADQSNIMLDGFTISDPVSGRFDMRLNIETVRTLEMESSRFSAERGRGSAGSLDVQTKMGDDRWRFGATNFVPSVSFDSGLHFNKWTPRFEASGPLMKGRTWFYNGFDAFYDVDTIPGLPRGENRTRGLTTSNITRFQVNLTPANILTGSFLLNYADATRSGLSFLDPVETTTNRRNNLYFVTIKDQIYFHRGALVELGFADTRGVTRSNPQGDRLYEITPNGKRGNYFLNLNRHTYRQEWLANAFLPAWQFHGSHQLKMGINVVRESFYQLVDRHDYRVLRNDDSVARYVTFAGNRRRERRTLGSSHYVQDRWTPREGMLIEAGLRTDWDEVVRSVLFSPRISAVWAPKLLRDTKLGIGYGIFYDALRLGILTQHQDQVSYSTFFSPNGAVARGPVETAFLIDERALHVPRYRNFSASVERKLPLELYGKAAYTHRVGNRGFMFSNMSAAAPGQTVPEGGLYLLRNWRHDRYDALELSVRRTFGGTFEWVAGYTRSAARTDAVVDYSLENPIFAEQAPGRVAWDTPNRFLTWGWAPVSRRLLPRSLQFIVGETSVAYLVEYRTGFPFSVNNEEGVLVGRPNSWRYSNYFNINLHFERKFRALHYLWAWRFGLNNLTHSGNPNVVNNNTDSPGFLAFGRGQARAFNVRLRFLGRK